MTDRKKFRGEYRDLVKAVTNAGFFVTDMPLDDGGDRVVCCGLRREQGGYTGNSFWLAERSGRWYVGAWGGHLYHMESSRSANLLALDWLSANKTITAYDVPSDLKLEYGLVPVDDLD
ncbi:MAG: hypothetical protein Aurels2KO_46930 [Aureliella sp.]